VADAVSGHRMVVVPDGTRLAYRVVGPRARGEPPASERIVLCDGISCDGFIWRDLEPHLAARHDVLHPNYRGHGRSGLPRDPDAATLPRLADDVVRVMDEAGFEDAVFVGHSLGVQVSLEVALRFPDRVRGAALLNGAPGRVLDTFKGTDLGAKVLPVIDRLTHHFRAAMSSLARVVLGSPLAYVVAALTEIKGDRIKPRDLQPYLDHFARMPMDLFTTLLADASERTTRPVLERITCPVLVMAGEDDGFTPLAVSRVLAETVPGAELVVVPGTSHTAPLEAPAAFEHALDAFLARIPARTAGDPASGPAGAAWPSWD